MREPVSGNKGWAFLGEHMSGIFARVGISERSCIRYLLIIISKGGHFWKILYPVYFNIYKQRWALLSFKGSKEF